jgi:single-strand DNA-binding protein
MYHQTTVIGYLGGDPEVRYLPSGSAVVEFSVATTEKWKDKNSGEGREHTEWYNCRCFGKLAEVIGEYRRKGDLVFVQGQMRTESWEKDGQTHYRTRLNVQTLRTMRAKDGNNQNRSQSASQSATSTDAAGGEFGDDFDDDIPF